MCYTKRVGLVILGAGVVGSSLVRSLIEPTFLTHWEARGVCPVVIAWADSHSVLLAPSHDTPLSVEAIKQGLENKKHSKSV